MADQGLARCLNVEGGLNLEQANARAEANIAHLAPRAIEEVLRNVAAVAELVSSFEGAPSRQTRTQLHARCCEVAGLAGAFGREALGKVAYSLCRLIDETDPGWSREAVSLHIRAMRQFCMPQDVSIAMQDQIVDGLVKVRRRLAEERKGPPPVA